MEGDRVDGDRPDGDELLATARELAGAEDPGPAPRVRRGTTRRRGRVIAEDGVETPRPVGVRSRAEEGATAPPPPERELLDAHGELIPPQPPAVPATSARTLDAGAVLAEAVRSYLEGLDQRGADDPVTSDRLDRLRRALAPYDRAT